MPEPTEMVKQGMNISISSLVSMGALGSMLWFVMQPLMISQISVAMAGEIEDTIDTKTRPIIGAFEAILQSDINRLKRTISRLEYKEEHKPDDWTEADADRLSDSRIELEAFQEALREIKDD